MKRSRNATHEENVIKNVLQRLDMEEVIEEDLYDNIDHGELVAVLAKLLCTQMELPIDFQHQVVMAAYLHDIGRFIDARRHQRHSWYLITHTKLPGLTASEQRIVAAAVRYHGKTLPRESHPEYASLSADEKVAVLKLAAILRVADALDLRSEEKLPEIKIVLRGRVLNIIADVPEFNSRRCDLKLKGGLFEHVFGLELKLLNGEL